MTTQTFLGADEAPVLADDHMRDPIEDYRPAAHLTWRQRRVDRRLPVSIGRETSGVLQRIHLPVEDHRVSLDTSVVTASEDLASRENGRSDRDPSFRQTLASLFDGDVQPGATHPNAGYDHA